METMPSAEFRRRYAGLDHPVAVTVNGHIIGRWVPGPAEYRIIDGAAKSGDEQRLIEQDRRTAQARRDEILRAVQRGSGK